MMIGEHPNKMMIGVTFKVMMEREEELYNEVMVTLITKFKHFFNKNTNGRRGN